LIYSRLSRKTRKIKGFGVPIRKNYEILTLAYLGNAKICCIFET